MKCENHHKKKLITVLPYNCLYLSKGNNSSVKRLILSKLIGFRESRVLIICTKNELNLRPILNIGPVYKGPLIKGQVAEITGQFSSELARLYQTDKLLQAISSLDVHHHRDKMALLKKFILLPPLRSPESFEATYRGPWPLVKKWPLVYLQTTKKAPKSISVARTDARTMPRLYPPDFVGG